MKRTRLIIILCILLLNPVVTQGQQQLNTSGLLLVACRSESKVKWISLETLTVVAAIKTEDGPNEIAVSPDGRVAVVSNYGTFEPGSTITVIDLENRSVLRTIDFGFYSRPHGLAFLPGGNRVIVTLEERKSVAIVDIKTGEIIKEIVTGQELGHLVAVAPSGKRAFVTNIGSGTVSVIDLEEGAVLKNIQSGRQPEGIGISPDGKEVWVTNRAEGTISIIDTNLLEVIEKLECKGFPVRLQFTPIKKHVLVSNVRAGYLSVFNVSDRKEIDFVVFDDSVVVYDNKFNIWESIDGRYSIEVKKTKF